jgi:hypothetical protein
MNRIKFFVYPVATVLALGAAFAAHAETPEPTQLAPQTFVASKTRDQAVAEYVQARKDGGMRVWSTQYNPLTAMKSMKTREEVRNEVMAMQAQGASHDFTGEDSGSFALARTRSVVTSGPLLAQSGVTRR